MNRSTIRDVGQMRVTKLKLSIVALLALLVASVFWFGDFETYLEYENGKPFTSSGEVNEAFGSNGKVHWMNVLVDRPVASLSHHLESGAQIEGVLSELRSEGVIVSEAGRIYPSGFVSLVYVDKETGHSESLNVKYSDKLIISVVLGEKQ